MEIPVARRREGRLGGGRVRLCDVAGRLRDVVRDVGTGEGWGATPQGPRATSPCRQGACCDMAMSQSRPAMSPRSHGGHPGAKWRHCDVAEPLCDVAVRHVGVALVRHCDVARHCDGIPHDMSGLLVRHCDVARHCAGTPHDMSVGCRCDVAMSHDIRPASPTTFQRPTETTGLREYGLGSEI